MNPVTGPLRDLAEIASALIGVAFVGMLIINYKGTVAVASGVSDAFSGALATATFQRSSFGNFANPT